MFKLTVDVADGLDIFTANSIEHFSTRIHPGMTLQGPDDNSSITRMEVLIDPETITENLLKHYTNFLNETKFLVSIYDRGDGNTDEHKVYEEIFTEFSKLAFLSDNQGKCFYQLEWSKNND